ncbi:IclR family transcriptional regulator [Geodermatophilus sp. YIM 151500]|uniref:IclR family transcriptional regulator n=1 Tax=Geodermatophilus sp. YIM 151500 TaxID=2984531 RepID=UPI0021E3B731|nr:IclR family transcriptional regulator [Geodermatophilus sp. YIM 151500]MCV2489322.1 IclR family transcriptional regulator [Geodermatophilus sp. YIM 151500]
MKNPPPYAISSVDHALQLATALQVEGSLSVSEAATRLGVARSTAHRLLAMLVYRDFAVRDGDRRYAAGPVLSLGASSQSRTALLRTVAMPHLHALVERVDETVNLQILAGDHVRFIASVECNRALRVSDREGMVFPAHLVSGGKTMLADLPDTQVETFYAEEKWTDRPGQRPDLAALRRELRTVRERGFAINAGRTEDGLTAIGRAVRLDGRRAEAAVSVSMPSVRFSEEDLPRIVAALALTTRDIEQEFARALDRPA